MKKADVKMFRTQVYIGEEQYYVLQGITNRKENGYPDKAPIIRDMLDAIVLTKEDLEQLGQPKPREKIVPLQIYLREDQIDGLAEMAKKVKRRCSSSSVLRYIIQQGLGMKGKPWSSSH